LFGDQDYLRRIQDVEVIGPEGRELYLAHRFTIRFIIAGLYVTDNGYVLAVKNSYEDEYYHLRDSQIISFQLDGLLPIPMPKYELSVFDYAFGYSLWIVILVMVDFSLFKRFFLRRRS
jgi:hypothetical protein